MSIWESVPLMTAIDLAISGAAAIAAWYVLKIHLGIRRLGLLGPKLVVGGLLVIGVFFFLDLATMWLLPLFATPEAAKEAMEALHLEWSWIAMLASTLMLTAGVVCTVRSVVEAEMGLERGQELYRRVVQTQTEFIVRWQPDGTRTFVNDAYCRYLETPREKLIGSSFYSLIAEEDRERIRREIASLTPESLGATAEYRVVRPDGSQGWHEWTHRAFFDAQAGIVELQSVGRDITDRERAEEALRTSEKRHRAVFELAADGIVMLREGRAIDCNQRLLELLGRTKEEILGKTPWELSPPTQPGGGESEKEARRYLARALAGERSVFEWRHQRGDGSTVDLEVTLALTEIDDQPTILCHIRDITERRQAEAALRDSEEEYRAIFDATADGLTIRRLRDGQMIAANPAQAEMLGYTPEELWRLPREHYVHPDSLPNLSKGLEAARLGKSHEATGKLIQKDGRQIDVFTYWVPMPYQGERQVLSVTRDITEEKRAEAELQASEEKFSKVFHGNSEPIIITSLSRLQLIDVNSAFERTLGYSREEALGESNLPLDLWVHPEDRDRLVEELRTTGKAYWPEVETRTKSGEIRLYEMSAFALELGAEPCSAIIGRDITERRQMEREKEKAWIEISRLKEELERERDYLREEVTTARNFGEIIGDSPALTQVLDRIEAVATTNAGVLIQGESGVGKELVAREIHSRSMRGSGPMVRVNCASVPRELFETEFFGHVKGAFTGAYRDRVGRFELAHRGTLFLDEVAEIPLELQAKLLRALQDGEYQRVGEERTRKADVRVIAATNRDLKAEADAGRFREDLYYRLSVFPLEVPPLRERREDILPLALDFLASACREFGRVELALSRQQAGELRRHDWPGNVRELRNVIEQAVILSRGGRLRLDLALPGSPIGPADVASAEGEVEGPGFVAAAELKRRERANLIAALEHAGWKVSGPDGAAELLGLKPTTLRYQMNALAIERPG